MEQSSTIGDPVRGIHCVISSSFGDTPLVRMIALSVGLGGDVLVKL